MDILFIYLMSRTDNYQSAAKYPDSHVFYMQIFIGMAKRRVDGCLSTCSLKGKFMYALR